MSRVTRAMRGGSQKVTNDDEGEGGGTIPPKNDDVIYEQPLKPNIPRINGNLQKFGCVNRGSNLKFRGCLGLSGVYVSKVLFPKVYFPKVYFLDVY